MTPALTVQEAFAALARAEAALDAYPAPKVWLPPHTTARMIRAALHDAVAKARAAYVSAYVDSLLAPNKE